MTNISPKAIIKNGAVISKTAIIKDNVFIDENVEIGDDTVIEFGAYITGHTVIGKKNFIGQYCVIGTAPQSLGYKNEPTQVIIGDENIIRENVEIHRGTVSGGGVTKIGNKNFIMSRVHFGHDTCIENSSIFATGVTFAGHVEVKSNVNIGGLSAIHQFCKIGEFAMIGGMSAVTQDIPPYVLAEGNRAKLRGLNTIGLRRNLGRDAVDALKPVYKKLFRNRKIPKNEANEILNNNDNKYVVRLCSFVKESKRGIPVGKASKSEED